jgi:hypothetical protein
LPPALLIKKHVQARQVPLIIRGSARYDATARASGGAVRSVTVNDLIVNGSDMNGVEVEVKGFLSYSGESAITLFHSADLGSAHIILRVGEATPTARKYLFDNCGQTAAQLGASSGKLACAIYASGKDIPLLVRYFANKYARRMGKQIESIPNETMDALSRYSWPGNIRELQNLMERAALLSTGPSLRVPLAEILNDPGLSAAGGGNALEQAEREQIVRSLRESNWVVGGARGAAARLGLKSTSLAYKIQKLGISRLRQ